MTNMTEGDPAVATDGRGGGRRLTTRRVVAVIGAALMGLAVAFDSWTLLLAAISVPLVRIFVRRQSLSRDRLLSSGLLLVVLVGLWLFAHQYRRTNAIQVGPNGFDPRLEHAALAAINDHCETGGFETVYAEGSSTMTNWRMLEPNNTDTLSDIPGSTDVFALFASGNCEEKMAMTSETVVYHAGRLVFGPNGEIWLLDLRETKASLPAPPPFSRTLDSGVSTSLR